MGVPFIKEKTLQLEMELGKQGAWDHAVASRRACTRGGHQACTPLQSAAREGELALWRNSAGRGVLPCDLGWPTPHPHCLRAPLPGTHRAPCSAAEWATSHLQKWADAAEGAQYSFLELFSRDGPIVSSPSVGARECVKPVRDGQMRGYHTLLARGLGMRV